MKISQHLLLTLGGLLALGRAHAADESSSPAVPPAVGAPAPILACPEVAPIALPQCPRSDQDRPAARRLFVALEGHASLLSDAADLSLVNVTFGPALKVGYRFYGDGRTVGVFVQIEQNLWRTIEGDGRVVQGALNLGVGGELLVANGFVRSSLAAGPSILTFDTLLDHAGTTGFFFDCRPVGLRYRVFAGLHITVDPLSFAVVAPVLGGIPLILPEYRTTIGVEGSL